MFGSSLFRRSSQNLFHNPTCQTTFPNIQFPSFIKFKNISGLFDFLTFHVHQLQKQSFNQSPQWYRSEPNNQHQRRAVNNLTKRQTLLPHHSVFLQLQGRTKTKKFSEIVSTAMVLRGLFAAGKLNLHRLMLTFRINSLFLLQVGWSNRFAC